MFRQIGHDEGAHEDLSLTRMRRLRARRALPQSGSHRPGAILRGVLGHRRRAEPV
jgi:hypothetical protein